MAAEQVLTSPELLSKIIGRLPYGSSLCSAARVNSTWFDLATNVVWGSAHQISVIPSPKRLADVKRARRQLYASKLRYLDFSDNMDCTIHSLFHGLRFPRMTDLVLTEDGQSEGTYCPVAQYLQPNLKRLEFQDWSDELTTTLLDDVAEKCPHLQRVDLRSSGHSIRPTDLVEFFFKLPALRYVGLDISRRLLTKDVLLQLSRIQSLVTLELSSSIKGDDAFQHVIEHNPNPFAGLKFAHLRMRSPAIPFMVQAFHTIVTLTLTLEDSGAHALNHVSKMKSLNALNIQYRQDNTIDLDSLMSLRSLSQLQHFGIGPEDKDGMAALDEDMTEGDFDLFITGFPSLIGFNFTLNHPLMVQSLSCLEKRCPKLRWITLGKCWDLSSLVSIPAPLFPNIHGIHIFLDEADIDRWATPAQLAGIIDNHAPKLTYFNVITDGNYSLGLREAWRALRGKYP
ncbi:hypothetical protein D6D19_08708 [Aureobasidium pullulans]|uniref:F-box domain-containing protein n=1 Tax=Aureobasidium pullulans TaxID=5580 RepID=A0A4S9IU59_AURPU|nr:hypothetical protein D6D23_03968 [Aureobasidium pullulans]THW61257.1 hypothetical protein D6D20_05177 [Aureobasidium pullulans]THW68889.1 hypothetical protein D6D19_08708 [Aureobasidium pullulans]THW78367.1 hypothetical protein D6D18_09633 [Aureobasidium pullulans]THX21779.1 hypothetical protein D6D12_09747 [Aureobasidium pullulans]